MVGFVCPVCKARWVTRSLEHDCWKKQHIADHYECSICVKERAAAETGERHE